MPIIKSAKKKLRQDKKRQLTNKKIKNTYKESLKSAKENPSPKAISHAFSMLDRAAKKGIIHANKAARLKSHLSKNTLKKESTKKPITKVVKIKKSTKKSPVKK